jgi:hypothetical protein
MITANRKYLRGLGVDLWTKRGAWFWQLAGRGCGVGTIGSALTENEALREADAAIAELSARCASAALGRGKSAAATVISHRQQIYRSDSQPLTKIPAGKL